MPLAFGPMLVGVFVANVRIGGRDRDMADGLAATAPLDGEDRAAARLMALVVPVGLAALTVAALAIATRLKGGFWLGEGQRRTDNARHALAELLQPVLLVALMGAIGVAVGRSRRWLVWAVVTGFALVFTFTLWWVVRGLLPTAADPVQMMPLRIELPSSVGVADTPSHWLVEYDESTRTAVRQLVHQPTVVAHDLYLLGLVGVAGAAIARDRRTVVRAVSAAVAVAGLALQIAVSPW